MSRSDSGKPDPHPAVAALAITAMAWLVAGVLELLGPLRAMDALVAAWLGGLPLGDEPRPVAMSWVWGWTGLATLGVAWAVLHVARPWQRWVVVVTAGVLTLAWLPVLVLMGRTAPPGVPLVALLWVSIGSLVYASRHAGPR